MIDGRGYGRYFWWRWLPDRPRRGDRAGRKLKAPVGYAFRGKQWLEHDNPYAVGLTGLLGYGGAYGAIKMPISF